MYAVFRSGGKQYRAAKGDVLRLEKIEADEGSTISFDDVLLIGEGADIKVGKPTLSGSSVSAKVVRQGKSKKVSVVKFKRRQNYLRQGSHRQFFTEVEITDISASGAKKAAPKKADDAADAPAVERLIHPQKRKQVDEGNRRVISEGNSATARTHMSEQGIRTALSEDSKLRYSSRPPPVKGGAG